MKEIKVIKEMNKREFWELMDKYGWSVDTDNQGQIVIYTGMTFDMENHITRWKDPYGDLT